MFCAKMSVRILARIQDLALIARGEVVAELLRRRAGSDSLMRNEVLSDLDPVHVRNDFLEKVFIEPIRLG